MGGQCQICRNYHEPVAPWLRPIPPLTGNVGRKPYRKLTGVVTVGSDIWSYSNTLPAEPRGPAACTRFVRRQQELVQPPLDVNNFLKEIQK